MPSSTSIKPFYSQLIKTWKLAWPVIIANLALPLLGLADATILGHLDDSVYLAGVTVGSSIIAYVFWGFNFLSMGLSGFTSQSLGSHNYAQIVNQLKRYSIVAGVLIFCLLLCNRLYINGGLAMIGAQQAVHEQADIYLTIRMLGVPAIVFNSMLLGFFIGLQNTRISLYTLSLTQVANIGLNCLFVFGLGYKTAGIAIGTVISEYVGLILILWQLKRTFSASQYKINRSSLKFIWSDFFAIFHVSSHLFIRSFVLLTGFLWFNRMSANFGELTLAANGILLAFFTLISHFLDGTAAAAEAQTGHAFGENNKTKLNLIWASSALLTFIFMLFLAITIYCFGDVFLQLLTNQQGIIDIAQQQLIWVSCLPISGGIAFWLDGVFIGARRSKDMRNSVLIAFFVFALGSYLFSTTNALLWMFFNVFFVIRSMWLITVFYKELV